MNVQDETQPVSEQRFDNIVVLQRAHLARLGAWSQARESKPSPDDQRSVHELMAQVQRTGEVLDREADRRAAQAVLDYWATELVLAGDETAAQLGLKKLAPFNTAAFPSLEGKPSPFMGLAAFGEHEAAFFFGRENAKLELAAKVESEPLVIVYGPSGSGKSSLIAAGLIPRLRETIASPNGKYELLDIVTPGSRPLAALVKSVVASAADLAAVRMRIAEKPADITAVVAEHHAKPVILIVDQFEEIFTLQLSDRRNETLAMSQALAGLAAKQHRVVISIREDHLEQLRQLAPLSDWTATGRVYYAPPPLGPRDIKNAIERPAEAVGLRFEDGVVEELVRDVAGEPAALPLLQFTLTQLWAKKERNRVTREVYRDVGRPREALKRAADKVLEGLKLLQNEEIARRLFLKLVTPAAENEFLRQPRAREVLWTGESDTAAVDRVLERFVDAGLLRKQPSGDDDKDDRFDVAHEALIRNWPWLVELLRKEWRDNEKFWRLQSRAKLWSDAGHRPDDLLSGPALDEARLFLKRSAELDALIRASEQAEEKREEDDRLRELADMKRKWISRVVAAGAVLLIGTVVTVNFIQRSHLTEKDALLREKDGLLKEKDALTAELSSVALINQTLEVQIKDASDRLDKSNSEKSGIATSVSSLDLRQLREFLVNIGVPAQTVGRLTLSEKTVVASDNTLITRDEERQKLSETVFEPGRSAPQASGLTCPPGYIWIGGKDSRVIDDLPRNTNELKGRTFAVNYDIRLRKEPPSAAYVMAELIGVVPIGTRLVAEEYPVGYPRPSGVQFWVEVKAPIEVCTRIFIQYVGEAARARRLADALKGLGYQVQPTQEIVTAKGKAEIRYFHKEDEPVASKLASQVSDQLRGTAVKPVSLIDWQFTKPPPGTVEVWLDFSGS